MTTPITVELGEPGETIQVAVSSVGDRGPQGDTGPANTLEIGTVQGGEYAAATITGAAPSQTLNLTLPIGPQGEPGAPGEPGATGPQGPQGAAGPVNTLTIGTVTTGAAGSNAVATITGASPSQTLNLTIPRGETGIQGAAGAQGEQGAAGPPGPRGAAGKGNDTHFAIADGGPQSVTNSATLTEHPTLRFPAVANSQYLVTMAWSSLEGNGQTKWSLKLPAGAEVLQALHQFAGPDDARPEFHLPAAANMSTLVLPFVPAAGQVNDGVNTLIAVVDIGATAGDVVFEWAQATAASGESADILDGSWLRAELVVPDPASAGASTAGVNVATPSANVTLSLSSKRYQFLAPSTSIDVSLPAVTAASEGLSFVLKNDDQTYYNYLTVKDSGGATLTVVYPQLAVELVCDGSGWRFISLGGYGGA